MTCSGYWRRIIFKVSSVFASVCCSVLITEAEYVPPYSEIVADASTGEVLYSDNANAETQPASLTKMMTLYVVFKEIEKGRLKLEDRVYFSRNAEKQKPSRLGIRCGASISVREAIIALVVKSANDVAVALAERVGGSAKEFVKLMNCYAKMLGMHHTTFTNPSGWKDKSQKTTATDMVKLARGLLANMGSFYPVFSIKQVKYCGSVIKNHNSILGELPGGITVDGMKTGYVAASGFNLVASATKNKKRIVAVVLGGPTSKWRDRRMKHLIQCAFNGEQPEQVAADGRLVNCGAKKTPIHKKTRRRMSVNRILRRKDAKCKTIKNR